jgi:hypothetical protein
MTTNKQKSIGKQRKQEREKCNKWPDPINQQKLLSTDFKLVLVWDWVNLFNRKILCMTASWVHAKRDNAWKPWYCHATYVGWVKLRTCSYPIVIWGARLMDQTSRKYKLLYLRLCQLLMENYYARQLHWKRSKAWKPKWCHTTYLNW